MPAAAKPAAKPPVRNRALARYRARRVFARLMEGQATADIAAAEGLSVRRVQQIVRAELARREANPAEDYLLMQVARLERAVALIGRQIDDGKATAATAFVRAVEALGRLTARPLRLAEPVWRQGGEVAALAERLKRLDAAREIVAERAADPAANDRGSQLLGKIDQDGLDALAGLWRSRR